ncbi:MAG: hypothetical protein V4555_11700 [Acidobacteriota bacterium]
MLDVHPPHHPTHTWRDFFIHIATICVGLLIAIGLEQTVEAIHHHHQIVEASEALRVERQENIRRFHDNIRAHLLALALLHNDLRIFLYIRDHPGTPLSSLPGVPAWPIGATEPLTAAWSTAQQTGVLERMPRTEVAAATEEYFTLDTNWKTYQAMMPLQTRCIAYLNQTADLTTLTPAEITGEIDNIKLRTAAEDYYGLELYEIAQRDPAYGPTPDKWAIDPFFHMQEELGLADSNPAQAAPTQRDIETALSALQPATPSHK